MDASSRRFPRWKTALLVCWFLVIVGVVLFTDERVRSHFVQKEPPLPQHDAELLIYSPQEFYNLPLSANTEFPIVSADEVDDSLKADQLVLGIEINGEARAYPIKMLCGVKREVVNDELGGVPIAATWCHLGNNGIVYSRQIDDDEALVFQPSDKYWKRSLLMEDQTASVWSLLMGRCMEGKYSGHELKQLPAVLTDFKTWRDTYPQTTVMMWPQKYQESYKYNRQYYAEVEKLLIEFCVGIDIRRVTKHYPFAKLRAHPLINDTHQRIPIVMHFDTETCTAWCYARQLDGETLEFTNTEGAILDKQTGSKWDLRRGQAIDGAYKGKKLEALPTITSYSGTWLRFHPKSEEWNPESVNLQSPEGKLRGADSVIESRPYPDKGSS